jgi:hypothetical protein
MTILAAIRREKRKLETQLGKLNHQLSGVQAAAKGIRSFRAQRNISYEEARPLGCRSSSDCQSGKKAMDEGSKAGEEVTGAVTLPQT